MMITVIIPALNEEKTIGHVVQLAKRTPGVTEVMVVDDKSLDNTVDFGHRRQRKRYLHH